MPSDRRLAEVLARLIAMLHSTGRLNGHERQELLNQLMEKKENRMTEMASLSRRGALLALMGAVPAAFAARSYSEQRFSVHTIGEAGGWLEKIALEPGRVIVAHHGSTSNGHTYPETAWSEAVKRGSIPIKLEGESLPVGQARDLRIDSPSPGRYVVSCVAVLMFRYADEMAQHAHAGRPVFLTPTGSGKLSNGNVESYELESLDLNHESAFRYASPIGGTHGT